ncbi:unnamed protein product [Brachionus calyciflorus]|uniref:HAT C-terminal dimerisation domain-containing protein n=1 Tax=Brachionus calyciflorus TaxID=104777 RepID=A0A814HD59_9BILA|nr:unnamed protein product [Brachionus calyciflorus]
MTGKNTRVISPKNIERVSEHSLRKRSKSAPKSARKIQSHSNHSLNTPNQPGTSSSLASQQLKQRLQLNALEMNEEQVPSFEGNNENSDLSTDEKELSSSSKEKTPSCIHLFEFNGVQNRYKCLLCNNNIASFLDLCTYNYLSENEKEQVEKELVKLYPLRDSRNTSQLNEVNELTSTKTKLDDFAKKCNFPGHISRDPSKKNIKDEKSYYITAISGKNDFSKFWAENSSNLPILTSIVKKTNVISATSVPSESAFRIAGYINRKDRSSLS